MYDKHSALSSRRVLRLGVSEPSKAVSHIAVAFFFVSFFSDSGTDAGGFFGKAHAVIFQQS
jgi:hypothetical protein